MAKQYRKLPVLALSACSIPVMLAFAGTGTRSTGVQSPSVTSEDVSFANDHHDVNADRVHSTDEFGVKQALVKQAGTKEVSTAVSLDALNAGEYNAASWMCMAPDGDHFWVANTKDASIATYRFAASHSSKDNVSYELVSTLDELADLPQATSAISVRSGDWVDLQLSEDGQWLYQLFEQSGTMAVYEVEGHKLELVETLTA